MLSILLLPVMYLTVLLLLHYQKEKTMEDAVTFACKAAAISVTRLGAQASAPDQGGSGKF